jgi:hypothetical protein
MRRRTYPDQWHLDKIENYCKEEQELLSALSDLLYREEADYVGIPDVFYYGPNKSRNKEILITKKKKKINAAIERMGGGLGFRFTNEPSLIKALTRRKKESNNESNK